MAGVRVFEPQEPSLGPEIDTVEVTVDGETRQRQRVQVVTDPAAPLATVVVPEGTTVGTITGAGQSVTHNQAPGDSSFALSVRGATGTFTFVVERSINAGLVASTDEVWTPVGVFQAGTAVAKSTWTQADLTRSALEFHGNLSSASRVRVRFTIKSDAAPVAIVMRSGRGTGTITVGNPIRLSDNEGNALPLINTTPVGTEWALPIRNVNPFQTIRNPEESRARAGFAYTSGTGQLNLTAAGNLRGTVSNPVGSGRTLFVYKISVFSSNATGYARMRINPSAGLPTTVRATNNNFIGHPNAGVGQLRADTSLTEPLAGGADSGIELAFASGEARETVLPPFIIPAGVTLGLSVPFAGATTVIANLYWWEE